MHKPEEVSWGQPVSRQLASSPFTEQHIKNGASGNAVLSL